jgi:geranyl-CoA carboxylase alpha subunit
MKSIRRLLVANRGEIARRVIRTAHRLGLQTVAVHAGADARALHVREAGTAVALAGIGSDAYLDIGGLIEAARASGADAVHPGYGFLSEDADFAQAVLDASLTWVGPPPPAMRLLGNKASARQLAQSLGVPVLPGYDGDDQTPACLQAQAQRIGYPVMVKAAAGGGGRGMRLVRGAGELAAALAGAQSEARAAFGSGQLLLERALPAPRHVEVQVFADAHGHCIHLGERDCSVQRRHQKIIEEAPSPAVDAPLRERLARCAVQLAQAAGYVGAGTVEFLLDGGAHAAAAGDAAFFLMEMNTRLQVEHPVTEALTGLDLVEWQLRIAQGEALPLAQEQVRFAGHAIEVRLCAEDEQFVPQTGTVRHLSEPAGVRFDHALFEGLAVTPHFDSLLGKLVVHAATRDEAIARLAAALDRTAVLGVPTNRRLLAACLRHPVFGEGRALIPFLQEQGDALRAGLQDEEQRVIGEAAVAALRGPARAALPCALARPLKLRHRGVVLDLRMRQRGAAIELETDGEARVVPEGGAIAVPIGDGCWHVQAGTVDLVLQDASFDPPAHARGAPADELRAPCNGTVIAAAAAQPGRSVARGETLLVLESMKLEHALAAPRDGVIATLRVAAGQQVASGQLLVTLEPAAAAARQSVP